MSNEMYNSLTLFRPHVKCTGVLNDIAQTTYFTHKDAHVHDLFIYCCYIFFAT